MKDNLIEIGAISISLGLGDDSFQLNQHYLPFLIIDAAGAYGRWQVHQDPIPHSLKFSSGRPPPVSRWEIKPFEGKRLFQLRRSDRGNRLWKVALMSRDFRQGEIWVDREEEEEGCEPLFFLDLLLWSCLLAAREGVIVHAAALRKEGKAYLFPGPAGCGKSTWTNLVSAFSDFEVLAEDKAIIREQGICRVFGTPWNPSLPHLSAGAGRLEGLFFLRPAPENELIRLSAPEVFRRLLQASFLPFPDKEGIQPVLTLAENLVARIPAYSFGFLPDKSALDFWEKAVRA